MIGISGSATAQKPTLKDIYPAIEAAPKELAAALAKAEKTHKRVILDFGGNWCTDCRVLDKYFHTETNAKLLKEHYILVDINVGNCDKNLDIATKYGVPLAKGVPALAVLDWDGKLLFSQKKGEFEAMRSLSSDALTEFLKLWAPAK